MIARAIREERPGDEPAVHRVNDLAFGQPAEADLVDALRRGGAAALSLVAEDRGAITGHILFTPVTIEGSAVTGMGLAPMAVMPDRQRQGVGSSLVRRGIEILRERQCPFVIVIGHPAYYPRFGFEQASRHGLICQWDGVPDEAFMALILDHRAMAGVSGVTRYRKEFEAG